MSKEHSTSGHQSDEELFKAFQCKIHEVEGPMPHIFIVMGASVILKIDIKIILQLKYYLRNILFYFLGRFSQEKNLSNIMVALSRQFSARAHFILRLCPQQAHC